MDLDEGQVRVMTVGFGKGEVAVLRDDAIPTVSQSDRQAGDLAEHPQPNPILQSQTCPDHDSVPR